jgi:DNA-directed RNA polymerase specialized sigma24 family protein
MVMRFYGGLALDEIADVLQISTRTVKRDWNYCRAWLKAELTSERGANAGPNRPN